MRILIAGASPSGPRTAQALRASGSDACIILLGGEVRGPYDRPPPMTGVPSAGDALPGFWSDQLDTRLQIFGRGVVRPLLPFRPALLESASWSEELVLAKVTSDKKQVVRR